MYIKANKYCERANKIKINPTVAVDKYAQNCFIPLCTIAPTLQINNVANPPIPHNVSIFSNIKNVLAFVFHNKIIKIVNNNPLYIVCR